MRTQFVNNSFRNGIFDERFSEILKDIHSPSNCECLAKTRVNCGVWRLLKPQTQTEDAKLQTVQNLTVKAASNVVKLLDKYGEILDQQSMEWATNSLALLGQANRLINNKRKESHKNSISIRSSILWLRHLYHTQNFCMEMLVM